jgi:hypothetical protein
MIKMAAVATSSTVLPTINNNSEKMASLLFLVALFQEKGDVATATKLIKSLQKYN